MEGDICLIELESSFELNSAVGSARWDPSILAQQSGLGDLLPRLLVGLLVRHSFTFSLAASLDRLRAYIVTCDLTGI